MGIKIGFVGCGQFGACFVPLFKAHPLVEEMVLCDLSKEKREDFASRFGIARTCPSLDALLQEDVDAVAIFTQHDRHAPQAVAALRAGKHTYSAVPSAITVAEMTDLVRAVEETRRTYMIGETSYYYPAAIYCRDRFRKGDFGQIVYGESEYMHDWSHGLEAVNRNRFGDEWMKHCTIPPFYYPTHSTSMIVGVTGAHAVKVCGVGVRYQYKPDEMDFTKVPGRIYPNDFANEVMLCQMSDGSVARFNEFRRVGYYGDPNMRLYGTEGTFEQQTAPPNVFPQGACVWSGKPAESVQDITAMLQCRDPRPEDMEAMKRAATHGLGREAFTSVSGVHPAHLLPKEYVGLPNGHNGSHQFLINDFITACAENRQGPNNVWQAARYLLPGLIAHESALKGGVLMDVPDFGDGSTTA